MNLSYTGTLFRRIVITSGFTYGKHLRVSYTHLKIKYAADYEDRSDIEFTYRRGNNGRWIPHGRLEGFDNEYRFWKALRWLEDNGYITISWNETVRVSRLLTGLDHFIKLTNKGLEVAPKYLAR